MNSCQKNAFLFLDRVSRVAKRCTEGVLERQPKCHFPILHRLAMAIEAEGTDGCISVSDLSRHLYDAPQAVSRGLRILEEDGLVERLADPADRRRILVRLTAQGQQAHDACQTAVSEFGAAVAERLGPERQQQLYDDLCALMEAMEAVSHQF